MIAYIFLIAYYYHAKFPIKLYGVKWNKGTAELMYNNFNSLNFGKSHKIDLTKLSKVQKLRDLFGVSSFSENK